MIALIIAPMSFNTGNYYFEEQNIIHNTLMLHQPKPRNVLTNQVSLIYVLHYVRHEVDKILRNLKKYPKKLHISYYNYKTTFSCNTINFKTYTILSGPNIYNHLFTSAPTSTCKTYTSTPRSTPAKLAQYCQGPTSLSPFKNIQSTCSLQHQEVSSSHQQSNYSSPGFGKRVNQ